MEKPVISQESVILQAPFSVLRFACVGLEKGAAAWSESCEWLSAGEVWEVNLGKGDWGGVRWSEGLFFFILTEKVLAWE
jgi:hypothetical protein